MSANEITPSKSSNGARAMTPRTPFNLLQREIDRVFDNFGHWRAGFDISSFSPSMDVAETDKAIEITTELPGMDEKDIEISVADDVLTIRGEKKAEKEEKNKNFRQFERTYGAFERSLTLPPGVGADDVAATLEKGVLKVTLPKPAPTPSQKVKISSSKT